jgi:zinc transport system ATP-binding protein
MRLDDRGLDREGAAAAAAGDELLRCDRLIIGHRGRPLLPPIDLTIRRGMLLAVVGRNGSGKSTWLKTALGFLPAVAGSLERPSPPPRLAYMAQASSLDAMVPVRSRQLVAWGALSGWSFLRPARARSFRAAAAAAMATANATDLGDAFLRDLSEGQKARVLLGRVLAAGADVAFLDEPTAAMDAVAEQRTMALLREHTRERRTAVVIVTHLVSLVRRYADLVLYLDRDDGVAVVDTPERAFAHPTFRRQYGEVEE